MKEQRRKHTSEFKARVVLEAIRGSKTFSENAVEFEIHPVMIGNWKKEMLENLPVLFEQKNARKDKDRDRETEYLQKKVGQDVPDETRPGTSFRALPATDSGWSIAAV